MTVRTLIFAFVFATFLGSTAAVASSTTEAAIAADPVAEKRLQGLSEELRCLVCQNQNIADSNAPIATDLRREIFRMLEEGQSNAQIVDFLVLRYGDFVLYKPPVNARTYLLWYGPFALLGLGALGLGVLVLRRRKGGKNSVQAALSVNERERLSALLQQNSQDSK